jgi:hypothetical protein
MGFGLVIQFIEDLQIVTTSNYSAVTNSCTQEFTIARTKSSQSAVLPGSGFQWWMLPLIWVRKLSLCLICQLLTAASRND